jgi:hypothetical protein
LQDARAFAAHLSLFLSTVVPTMMASSKYMSIAMFVLFGLAFGAASFCYAGKNTKAIPVKLTVSEICTFTTTASRLDVECSIRGQYRIVPGGSFAVFRSDEIERSHPDIATVEVAF